ncbi:ATP-binding protein [Brevundimonas sp.]|uniref:ATP-binding protein n=1 Tax=Brevundimonas sp. TaxID=1871086 RepID=UPI0025EF0EDA|nr:ATP-binding protein [Brevundimonas sp.]
MTQPNGYAVMGDVRARELRTRLALGVFLGGVGWLLTPGWFPFAWFAAMCAAQAVDWWVFRPVRQNPYQEPSRARIRACMASAALNTAVYSAISAYTWTYGGGPGQLFAYTAIAGGLLHVSMHMHHARPVLIAAAVPHALYFLGLPLATMIIKGYDAASSLAVSLAGVLYIAHLIVAVRQSSATNRALRGANDAAEEARARAERASAAKSDFLATISHEIRTPMNAVISAGHLLRRTPLTRDQREPVDMLLNAGDVLMGLLNDVLDVAKIEAGKMELETAEIDLHDRLTGLARLWGAKAEEAGVEMRLHITPGTPERIRTDPLRFQQVLSNLLSNAVKFTERGEITLSAGVEGETLWFEVRDTGCGVSPEMAERLFGHFEQAEVGTTRRYGGTGLGLAISRKLADLMGGTLRLAPHEGRGSTFRFETPWLAAEAAARPAVLQAQAALTSGGSRRVLVAEDHEVNRRILALMLEPAGYELTFAVDGGQAVETAKSQAFDAILMDMQMPVMDGLQAAGRIRAGNGPNAATPVIALTANALDHHRAAWAAIGVSAFLTKPINPEALFSALGSAVETRRAAAAA